MGWGFLTESRSVSARMRPRRSAKLAVKRRLAGLWGDRRGPGGLGYVLPHADPVEAHKVRRGRQGSNRPPGRRGLNNDWPKVDLFDELSPASHSDAIELLGGKSSARLYRNALRGVEQDRYFGLLLGDVPWQQHEIRLFGKVHLQPRLVAWYGDAGRQYSYSGIRLAPLPWIEPVLLLKRLCEKFAETDFNSVLLNLYRDGQDTVGWHSDDEPELGPEPVIASLSLGAERAFRLRNKATGASQTVELPAGSVLVMSGRCQEEWEHHLPRRGRVLEPRINLTFRQIRHV